MSEYIGTMLSEEDLDRAFEWVRQPVRCHHPLYPPINECLWVLLEKEYKPAYWERCVACGQYILIAKRKGK